MVGFEVPKDRMAIGLSVLATVGWLTFTAGFGVQNAKQSAIWKNHSALEQAFTMDFPYYGMALLGLVGTGTMLLYSASRGRCMGVLAMFFNLIMMACAGAIMSNAASQLGSDCFKKSGLELGNSTPAAGGHGGCFNNNVAKLPGYLKAEFAGAFLYALFQGIAICILFWRAHDKYDNFA
jgi:hypothetical protein